MNRIPRKFKSITGTFLGGNVKGIRMIIVKDEYGYHGREADTGKEWNVFASHLRIPEFFRIENIEI